MYCTLKFEHWKNCIQSSGVDWLEFFVPVSKYQDVPGYSGNIRENIGFRPKQVNRPVQEKKTKKKKRQLKNIPKRAHHLRRCQVFSVASVYPIVPTAPSSSSSSRLLYPDVTSLLLMNFLITMPPFFFFFDKMPFVFSNCALLSFCLISVPNPCLTPMWMADGSIHLSSKYFEYCHCHVSNMHLTLVCFFIIYYYIISIY